MKSKQCVGLVMGNNKKSRCLSGGKHPHMSPRGVVYFLCDSCEADAMFRLEHSPHMVNDWIVGGSGITGIPRQKRRA
jgi:hypothetical protein